jgi:cysteinyl-tRNA synthetase
VRKFPGYGKLSGKSIDELHAGERVAVLDGKDDPLDFVLWKSAKPTEPDDAKWASNYGPGRPGWHIECSAMACALLGESFDIHGGGADLQFPHHENEIAQSEGAFGKPMAKYWVHNGFVNIDNEKMSKSLGNFFTIREVLQQFDAETIRFFIVRSHYRSPLNYSDVHLEDARASLKRLYTALDLVAARAIPVDWNSPFSTKFKAAMDNDFGTSDAVAVLFELAAEVNRSKSPELASLLKALGGVLGILQGEPKAFLQWRAPVTVVAQSGVDADTLSAKATLGPLSDEAINMLITERASAKAAKDFARADQIRKDLLAQGIVLKDAPTGTTWEAQK